MTRPDPTHPGEVIRYDCIEACSLTIAEAAAHMGVDERELTEVCHARAPVTADLAIRIDMAFGGRAMVLLKMQACHDLAEAQKRAADLSIERVPAPDLEPVPGD